MKRSAFKWSRASSSISTTLHSMMTTATRGALCNYNREREREEEGELVEFAIHATVNEESTGQRRGPLIAMIYSRAFATFEMESIVSIGYLYCSWRKTDFTRLSYRHLCRADLCTSDAISLYKEDMLPTDGERWTDRSNSIEHPHETLRSMAFHLTIRSDEKPRQIVQEKREEKNGLFDMFWSTEGLVELSFVLIEKEKSRVIK